MEIKNYLINEFNLDDTKLNKLEEYYKLIIEENQKYNLTAITNYDEFYIKHFYDSLLLNKVINLDNLRLLDIGSGAGFPGLVLSICHNVDITLIDSLGKRINFLNMAINKLELSNVRALHTRAEDYAKDNRESFDLVTARAVARLNILAELAIPLVKLGGYFIAMKGQDDEELKEAMKAIETLGAKLVDSKTFNLPLDMGTRHIYVFKKVKETPNKYPRSFAKIKSNPIGGKNV